MIYKKQAIASSSVVNANAKLSYIGLFDLIEDAITECMGVLELDAITVRRKYNAFWVFTKNKVRLFGTFSWGDRIFVESFVSSLSPAKMIVDTALKREDGTIAAYSRCEMCVLDISSGRIRRTSTVGIDGLFAVEQPQCEISFEKIDEDDLPQCDSVIVRSTNIDYSRHCNNVEYLRFVFNTYTVEELDRLNAQEIEVCYISQAYEGDALTVHKGVSAGKDIFVVKKNGAAVIKCGITRRSA